MKPPRGFDTPRLRLRPPDLQDADVIFEEYARDPEVTRYLTWRPHKTIVTTLDFLRHCSDDWEGKSRFSYAVVRKDDDHLIGMAELRIDDHGANLGYVLARPYWGNGYATEAVSSLVQWAMSQASFHRVWAICDIENLASARVLEKAGMQREGILRRFVLHPNAGDTPRDCMCYSLIRKSGK